MNLEGYTTEELQAEIRRRDSAPRLWGYPIRLQVRYNGEWREAPATIKPHAGGKLSLVVDHDKVLDVIQDWNTRAFRP